MPSLKNPMVPHELLIVGAALKVGVFDYLHGKPAKLDELAKSLSLDLRAVWTVVEALISLGYLVKNDEILSLTPSAVRLLFDENSEDFIGYSLIHTLNVIKSWTSLPEILKTGLPPRRERDVQDMRGFMAAMKKKPDQVYEVVVKVCMDGLGKEPFILDVGGGPLNFARPFAVAGAKVTVQDLPEICALMQPTIAPEENIRFSSGDFTKKLAPGQFDLVFLGNICHIYGADENLRLFKNVIQSLRNGGRVAILDFVRGVSPRAELFAVNMLANTETGGTWTFKQYASWLETAGFDQVVLKDLGDGQVITAQKN